MSVRLRLGIVLVLVATLPALAAVGLSRDLIGRAFDLTLTPEIDGALEAGLEQARSGLVAARQELEDQTDAWVAAVGGATADDWTGRAWKGQSEDHVELRRADQTILLQAGAKPSPLPVDENPTTAPPQWIQIERSVAEGWTVAVRRPVDDAWRENAANIASGLQLVRALGAERENLDRSFRNLFLALYGASLLLGLTAAILIGRGLTQPIARLGRATERVRTGDWTARVDHVPAGEIGRLTRSFNAMVDTLNAQSQRLVDLETMAGWREMARALAHEVKNPLTPIQLTVEEMREQYSGEDVAYRELLEECTRIVVEEVESLRGLVGRFREFSRPVELEPAPVDLHRLVRDIGALQRGMEVELDLDPALDGYDIRADAVRLRQVLLNLSENARQIQEGQPVARLVLRTFATNHGVRITVEDSGPGIAPEERTRVFEPYHSGRAGGLGLGLSLVKGIVLAHGGQVHVAEGSEGGAAFIIELPSGGAAGQEES